MTKPNKNKPRIASFLIITYILIFIGLLFISVSSLSEAQINFGDKFYYIKKQIFWVLIGTISFIITSKIKLSFLKKYSFYLFLISIATLILVLIPGIGNTVLGARRWLSLGIFSFQPSESFKLIAIIYFSFLFSKSNKQNLKSLIYSLSPALILIILEPNLSTAVLTASIVLTIYYLSGGEIISLMLTCLIGVLLSVLLIFVSPYRQARLDTLLNPQNDTLTSSYHSNQIVLSLASGGIFGKGFGNSVQKYQFLPQLTTDSILAIIGEELGFVGITIIISLYVFLVYNIFRVSRQSKDTSQQLIVAGIAAWISYQSLINISAIANVIPLTGVPLPFISYGGSSLLMLLTGMGLVNNIYRHNQ